MHDRPSTTRLEISVRGGEHNVGGSAVWDGGLMIDLSLMKGVHINARYSTLVPFRGFTLLLALFLNAHPPSDRKGAPPAPETRSASLRSSGFVGGFVGGPERSGARRGAEDFRTRVSPPVR